MPFHFSTHHQQHIKHGNKRQERGIYQEHYTSMNVTRNPGSSVGKRWPTDNLIITLKLSYYDWNTIWKDIKVSHPFNIMFMMLWPEYAVTIIHTVLSYLSKISLHQLCSCNYTYCLELSFVSLAVFSVNKTDSRSFFHLRWFFYCLA